MAAVWSATWLVAVGLAQTPDLKIEVTPLFEGVSGGSPFFPLKVQLSNRGRDAQGSLAISGPSQAVKIPVSLPSGARKELTADVAMGSNWWQPTQFQLVTNRGVARAEFNAGGQSQDPSSQTVGMVTDTSGTLAFVKTRQNQKAAGQDCYIWPDQAPERAVSYSFLGSLVLGEGSERLSDRAVQAIQSWGLSGGQVVFFGGASSPVLRDPRWKAFLPVIDPQPRVVDAGLFRPDPPAGQASMMVGGLAEGATVLRRLGNQPLVAAKPLGLGRVVFFAVDPTEGTLARWQGRKSMFLEPLAAYPPMSLFNYVGIADQVQNANSIQNDPFSVKFPTPGTIWGILLLYVFFVVPVNLLTLKKMGRSELAWFTTPIISLVFAGIFFQFAAGLYSAQLSRASTAALCADSRLGTGYWVGKTQIFFSRGGSYDLQLQGVEALWMGQQAYGGGMGAASPMADVGAIDTGEITAPGMRANNLSFHELSFAQKQDLGSWFVVQKGSDGTISVQNNSPFGLTNGILYRNGRPLDIPDVAAGKSVDVRANWTRDKVPSIQLGTKWASSNNGNSPEVWDLANRSVLVGSLQGVAPGPKVGMEVAQRTRLDLFLNLGRGELD